MLTYHHDPGTAALNREIQHIAAETACFAHDFQREPDFSESICSHCGDIERGSIGGCLDRAGRKHFVFVGDCAALIRQDEENLARIKKMVRLATPVTREVMARRCRFPDGHDGDMAQDSGTGYYRSKLDGFPCFFYQHSGFEFIYLATGTFRFKAKALPR